MSQKVAKTRQHYICEKCNYVCCKESDYNKHILTRKHQNRTNRTKIEQKVAEKSQTIFTCECGKEYNARNSLWYHRKVCTMYSTNDVLPQIVTDDEWYTSQTTNSESKEIIQSLLQDNREMRSLLIELVKNNIGQTTNNNTNNHNNNSHNVATNSHNKTFNLQFFLNETCKDAMNITDFVSSLKLTLQDLEKVGELGYAEGISRMFVRGLNDLDVTKRPIHCSDLKRDILHIKDKDKWERDINQDKLKKAIKDLSTKNIMLLDDWQKENPGCKDYNNQKNDIYLKMMVESLGPVDTNAERKDFGKIIRTIAKNTIIAKAD